MAAGIENPFNLSGKVAIVTGAARGIGQGIAESLARHGATVVLADKNEQLLRSLTDVLVEQRQGIATCLPCDIGNKKQIDNLVDWTACRLAKIDILVNNAFHWLPRPMKRFGEITWGDCADYAVVNNVGTRYLSLRVAEHMRERKVPGSIIFITSVHEWTIRRDPLYAADKAGEAMFMKELAVEYGPDGIRVNAVAPGHTVNDTEQVACGEREKNPYIPLKGESMLPEDIANTVLFLASPLGSRITGVSIAVDGGERHYGEWVARTPPGPPPAIPLM